jgi:hypothetical protein
LLTSLVSQNTSMMTLVPAEKRAPRGTESLEVVESPTYPGNQILGSIGSVGRGLAVGN